MSNLPEILAAGAFFGLLFVCPLVLILVKHQRAMAEIIHRSAANELSGRIAALEQQVDYLRRALGNSQSSESATIQQRIGQ